MGAFLFYLLKSGCCLVVFYIFFKLLMSRSTFFHFNRITLLVGLLGCTLLPLIELTTTEETFLHTPLYAIHEILQSTESVILNPEQMEDPILISEKNPEINSLNWIPVTLAFIYGVGALVTLIWLSLSTCRLIQLIRTSEKKQFGNYVLVIPQQPTASFSWGKYIVISAADYSQQSEEILYVFAQPEVKEVPRQIQSELQQKEADDYSSLMFFFKEGGERYSKLVNGAYPPSKIKARQVHSLFVNKQNRVMFDNDVCSVDELKSTIVKNLMKSWEESKRKEYQVISFQVDRGSEIAALTTILKEVKGAFEQIRADLSITLTDKSEEALDRLFPVLLSEGAARNYGLKELSMEEKISGIVVTIHTSEGKEVMKDYTLTELKQKVTAARAKQAADPESLVIGLKIEKGCKMGYVTDTKQVLRECSALKINYSTDN